MISDPPKSEPIPNDSNADAPKVPVDQAAQEEAAKVREESGGYD